MSTSDERLGPRPISLHMAMAMWTWTGSLAALPLVQSGSMQWMPKLAAEAARLTATLRETEPPALAAAVKEEAAARAATLVEAIDAYRAHPYSRDVVDPEAMMALGAATLRDYGGDGPPTLFVPSLVNRAYILDLSQRRSLLRWLSARGVHPYLLDWGTPGADEKAFSIVDYIDGPLKASLATVCERHGGPINLVGYCMGGNLALAAALRYPEYVGALALLATPWDFHAERSTAAGLLSPGGPVEQTIAAMGSLPVDLLQAFFASLDPLLAARKFRAFGALAADDPAREDFVALEDWLNDGVPLAGPVARECFVDWYGENLPGQGAWAVAETLVDPGALQCPAFVVLPDNDRLVPPGSARALADQLPDPTIHAPVAGHIGMVVGRKAEAGLWAPLRDWLIG
jgi:polyhydroxyalkanoate synthase subunit PhaC